MTLIKSSLNYRYGSCTYTFTCYWCPSPGFYIGRNRFALINCTGTLKLVLEITFSECWIFIHILMMQMPRGVPVATVAVNNATNAGLLAVRMLGVGDADLLAR